MIVGFVDIDIGGIVDNVDDIWFMGVCVCFF
jgi:hypothetical protein